MTRVAVLIVITTALAALFAFGLQPRNPRDLRSNFQGRPMNDFEAPVLERYRGRYGDALQYSDHAGHGTPLVVNFWASWCIPACWNEAPRLEAAWRKYRPEIFMIGVNFQDEPQDAEDFLERFGKTYPSVRDGRGTIGIDWGMYGVPETYFIRGDGTLNFKHSGEISTATLEAQIEALLQ